MITKPSLHAYTYLLQNNIQVMYWVYVANILFRSKNPGIYAF